MHLILSMSVKKEALQKIYQPAKKQDKFEDEEKRVRREAAEKIRER